MFSAVVSRLIILLFGTLYPAYASYKAVKTKNVKEYVKWMMYWIVFALFTCAETFTDVFLCWFPFYYELKIIIVIWLLSPATKGSSILYRKFVHPLLSRREQEIDEYINKAKEQGYHTVLHLGSKGVNYATTVIMQTAIKIYDQFTIQQKVNGTKNLNIPANTLASSQSDSNINHRLKQDDETDFAPKRSISYEQMDTPELSTDNDDPVFIENNPEIKQTKTVKMKKNKTNIGKRSLRNSKTIEDSDD